MPRKYLTINLIFPLVSKITKRKFWKFYRQSIATQWMKKDELEKMQLVKFKNLLKHSYENVPYYQELLEKNGLNPTDIQSLADIKKIPITTKSDLQKVGIKKTSATNLEKFDYYNDSTSGSTGEPFSFLGETKHRDISTALTIRGYNWAGYQPGEPMISLWGYHKENIPTKIYKYLLNQKTISAFDIDNKFQEAVAFIKRFKPKLLVAYTSAIVQFAKLCEINEIKNLHIPAIIASAETLYPEHRKLIEKIFSAKVFNRYGSRELGEIAHECEQCNGLHVSDEHLIVEFEPFEQFPKWKKIIVTHLDKYAMPLIRYDTGDLGIVFDKKCPCGRELTLIKEVNGRTTDFLRLKSGKLIPFLYFNYIFEQYGPFIKGFQIIQKSWENIIIKIIPTEQYSENVGKNLIQKLSEELSSVKMEIEEVKSILPSKSGKKITVISEI